MRMHALGGQVISHADNFTTICILKENDYIYLQNEKDIAAHVEG